MKNRKRGVGGTQSLKLCIRSSKLDLRSLSVDEVVEHLRSNYTDFCRLQLRPFKKAVSRTLDGLKSRAQSQQCEAEGDFDDCRSTTIPYSQFLGHKRRKRFHSNEVDRRFVWTESGNSRNLKELLPLAPSISSVVDDEGDSNLDDATFEPKFDLMKAMIRSNYAATSSKFVSEREKEKIVGVKVDEKVKEIESAAANWTETEKTSNNIDTWVSQESEAKKPNFTDFGGMGSILGELRVIVALCFFQPHLLKYLGVKPITGILLHGPPGCGKTRLAHAMANESGVNFHPIAATEVISGVSGESEENIRSLFLKAHRSAPSIIFIDEIDAIGSKREKLHREMECRVVTQLLTCMDEMHQTCSDLSSPDSNLNSSKKPSGHVLVIAATNRPDALDPALRRPGRFDREIALCAPNENARQEILSVLVRELKCEDYFDVKKMAMATPGFVGADLKAVVNEAGILASKRILHKVLPILPDEPKDMGHFSDRWKIPMSAETLEGNCVTMADFDEACKVVQPFILREGFSAIPKATWEDVGGLASLREEFDRHIIRRIKYPEHYKAFGMDFASGILLYGPPGCGKTLIAQAVANEAGANFIYKKGPDILSKYVGESESEVRKLFNRARSAAPCIIFFDEVDALTTDRNKDGDWVGGRVLNQLLIELDGADRRRGVYVIGATNRLEAIDRAVLRPGRLGTILYVPLPGPEDRVQILRALTRELTLESDVDLDAIGRDASNSFSGADLRALVNEAFSFAERMRENQQEVIIKKFHFEKALQRTSPSVSLKQKRYYEAVLKRFKQA